MNFYQIPIIFIVITFILCTGCTRSPDTLGYPENKPGTASNETMHMSVSSVINGSMLPNIYSCNGPGQIPAIFWSNPPEGTKSMVLIMDDPDASGGVFTHWIVYNISPGSGSIPPNQLPVFERAGTGYQGINSLKTRGYAPPCPPDNTIHRYIFTLYALDNQSFPDIPDRVHMDEAMQGHVLSQVRIVTLFGQ